MNDQMSASAKRVQDALADHGIASRVLELPASTRTAVEAANAIGCEIGQIVKSLVFQTIDTGQPVLVMASGANRVNEDRLGAYLGEKIVKASADFVRQSTGYAIGGVPPLGLAQSIKTFIDEDLMKHEEIWAAAGTPHAVFCLTPAELEKVTDGAVTSIK